VAEPEGGRGRILRLQRYSLQDGPGLRTTVFLKGCPLACAWCHNPESQAPEPEALKGEAQCLRCGSCDTVPPGADQAEACPTGAFQWVGRDVTVAELVAEVLRDRPFFEQSGGGVTFSGGEPLMQAPFVAAALAALRAEGASTALDTCGFGPWADLEAVAKDSDLVLYDLKLIDAARHLGATGVPSGPILENLARLGRVHPAIWIRVPLIPGLNDDDANLEATARIAADTPGVRRVDLLPYHATGLAKAARLGRETTAPFQAPSAEALDRAAAPFRALGLNVHLGGRP